MALKGTSFPLSFTIETLPITVFVQNSHYLAKIVTACLNHAMMNFGHHHWLETLMQDQVALSQETMSTNQLSPLMDQTSHTLPFSPRVSPGESIPNPYFSPWTPSWTAESTPPTTSVIGSKNVHEHLEASDSELESLIVKLGVPKTKAILLQQQELIEFIGQGRNAYRTVSKEHGDVQGKSKVNLRTRLRRLGYKSKSNNGLEPYHTDATGQPHEGEPGKPFLERERQVTEKEVTNSPQDVNEFHNLEC